MIILKNIKYNTVKNAILAKRSSLKLVRDRLRPIYHNSKELYDIFDLCQITDPNKKHELLNLDLNTLSLEIAYNHLNDNIIPEFFGWPETVILPKQFEDELNAPGANPNTLAQYEACKQWITDKYCYPEDFDMDVSHSKYYASSTINRNF